MKKVNIFLDSSALIAGVLSTAGAAHALLILGEDESVLLTISLYPKIMLSRICEQAM
jgi:hypothetical protein